MTWRLISYHCTFHRHGSYIHMTHLNLKGARWPGLATSSNFSRHQFLLSIHTPSQTSLIPSSFLSSLRSKCSAWLHLWPRLHRLHTRFTYQLYHPERPSPHPCAECPSLSLLVCVWGWKGRRLASCTAYTPRALPSTCALQEGNQKALLRGLSHSLTCSPIFSPPCVTTLSWAPAVAWLVSLPLTSSAPPTSFSIPLLASHPLCTFTQFPYQEKGAWVAPTSQGC